MKEKTLFLGVVLIGIIALGSCSFVIDTEFEDSGGYGEYFSRLMIPQNAEIVSAELHMHVYYEFVDSAVINLHRVTAPWEEYSVTWANFAGAYDTSEPVDSVTVDSIGWYSFDIKDYLIGWVEGRFSNYGLLLDQADAEGHVIFSSRNALDAELHPYIKVTFSVNGEILEEAPEEIIADAYIREDVPDYNGGYSQALPTGLFTLEKQSLVKFQLDSEPGELVGTGTPGYWKNHPEAWPVDEIVIGGILYGKEEAIELMWMPVESYKWFTMFRALVAAKLNVLSGADDASIADTILAADLWMGETPVPESLAHLDPWQEGGEALYEMLDAYNNGELDGAPSRDDLE